MPQKVVEQVAKKGFLDKYIPTLGQAIFLGIALVGLAIATGGIGIPALMGGYFGYKRALAENANNQNSSTLKNVVTMTKNLAVGMCLGSLVAFTGLAATTLGAIVGGTFALKGIYNGYRERKALGHYAASKYKGPEQARQSAIKRKNGADYSLVPDRSPHIKRTPSSQSKT